MLKLVIADNDARTCSLLQTLVDWNALGFEPIGIASTAGEALELIQRRRPDILITDIHMPEYNGLELFARAKTIKPRLEGIIISRDASFEYAQSAIRLGMCDYLLKPVSQQQLMQALKRLTARFESRQRPSYAADGHPMESYAGQSPNGSAFQATQALPDQQPDASSGPIQLAKEYILEHYQEPITLEKLCEMIGFSISYFSTKFKNETGESFIRFLTRTRIEHARKLLMQTNLPVSEICPRVGYSDLKHFTQTFKRETGLTPGQYRKLHS